MLLKRISDFFLDILEVFVFSIAIFLFVYLLILQPHKIRGDSMLPNYFDGEYLLTDKLSYRLNDPKRGDVIVFKAPGSEDDEFIKRIIGLPNETISFKGGEIYINNNKLEEDYLPESAKTATRIFIQEGQTLLIPENSYFVLGDNRNNSSDSRVWGFITKDKINGKAWLIYWPLSNIGFVDKITYN